MGNKQNVGSQDNLALNGTDQIKKTRPSMELFDTLNGVFPEHFREVFNALDQRESKIMTWFKKVFDHSKKPLLLQPIRVRSDQKQPFK